ncbi:MAG: hypothetical protein ABSF63_09870 [Candidatus Bathyarchaeia archaeon]|jgi:hypothetical protein
MAREGYRHSICYSVVKTLKRVGKRVGILNPDAVTFLTGQQLELRVQSSNDSMN